MNKKLLIAAVGMALVAGPMMTAQAAPTVYGRLNVGIASIDNGNDTDSSTLGVSDDASRLGVKGDEDLGGGLKAIYTFEMTIDGDNGAFGTTSTGAQAGRDVFVGLQGSSWGSVRLGNFNSVYKNLSTGLEVFGDTIGDFSSFGMSGETREPNQISYSSPNFSGFVVGLSSSRGETGTSTESNPMLIAVSYDAGPLYVGFGINDVDNQSTTSTGMDDAKKFVARFNMDAFSVWAVIEKQSWQGDTSTQAELDTTHVGASFKMGNNTFALTQTNTGSTVATSDTSAIALGVIHAMSKTTAVKVVWTDVDNDASVARMGRLSAANSSVGMTNASGNGKDPSGLGVQLSVSF